MNTYNRHFWRALFPIDFVKKYFRSLAMQRFFALPIKKIASQKVSIISIQVLILILSFFVSCDFGNTNIDPIRPKSASLKEILPSALVQTAHNLTSISGRVTGIVVQHFKGIDAQPESYSQYLIDERTLDELWKTGLYVGAMKDCQILIDQAVISDQYYYQGIAQILMAINLGISTSFWGEIPFEEAFLGLENLQPEYDSQEKIYDAIQELLKTAINNLQELPPENAPLEGDLIFGGDVLKWIATAKALQARYFLHLSKRRWDAAQNALQAIRSGAFQTLVEQANFPFGDNLNEANPLPLYCFERPDQLALSDYLFQLLDSTNDPRLYRFTSIVDGIPIIHHLDSSQLYWGQFDAPLPLISLTELKFIEAEALLRLGEIEAAELVFQNAVIAHFEQMNIPSSEYGGFLNTYIHFNGLPNFEKKLEHLIQQKHLALYAQNPIEAWVDFRRTGFPNLSPPPGVNPSLNPSMVIPKRYLYPISERNSNEANLNEAIQRQGGHLLDVNIWAFK